MEGQVPAPRPIMRRIAPEAHTAGPLRNDATATANTSRWQRPCRNAARSVHLSSHLTASCVSMAWNANLVPSNLRIQAARHARGQRARQALETQWTALIQGVGDAGPLTECSIIRASGTRAAAEDPCFRSKRRIGRGLPSRHRTTGRRASRCARSRPKGRGWLRGGEWP